MYRSVYLPLFVTKNNIYIAGWGRYFKGVVWKNGNITYLSDIHDKQGQEPESIFVYRNNVYVVGSSSTTIGGIGNATIWQNGISSLLSTSLIGDYQSSRASSVFVIDDNAWVVGWADKYTEIASYPFTITKRTFFVWKNGVPIPFGKSTDENHYPNCVFVVKR